MDILSQEYDVKDICEMMRVSRSGYYKWKNRKPSKTDVNRQYLIELVRRTHEQHRTHGYRWVAAYIRINESVNISNGYAYKCFRFLGIKAETMHKIHYRPRKEKDKYPNLVYSTWETVDRPRQVIVSDMTMIKGPCFVFEVTFYFDVFTKEMLTHRVGVRRGDRTQYLDGLEDIIRILRFEGLKGEEPTILHTDQGSVYSSFAYNDLIKDENIVRSMSRAGTPTDNPVNEALNGWIKEELIIDFDIESCRRREDVLMLLAQYQYYYNRNRPCFALDYDTPRNFYERFMSGEIVRKETFKNRQLTDMPKFKRKQGLKKSAKLPCLL